MYAWIISTAQQAKPNVIGHSEPVRAQFTTLSIFATMKPLSAISPVIPFTTASCSGPRGSASRFQAIAVFPLIVLLLSQQWCSFPLQRSLAPLVDKANGQHGKEADHRQETKPADVLEGYCPRK